MDTVSVDLPRYHIRQEAMPNLIGLLGQGNAMGFRLRLRRIEQAKFHL